MKGRVRPDSQVNNPGLVAEPSTGNVESLQNPAGAVGSHGSGGASDLADQASTAAARTGTPNTVPPWTNHVGPPSACTEELSLKLSRYFFSFAIS